MKTDALTSDRVLRQLCNFESRNVTFVAEDFSWPIVWARARGVHVWDMDGRRYLDLTAAFGVANAGHANPRVVRAARHQLTVLPHAMGDVHPHALKAELVRMLSLMTFERWGDGMRGKTILCNSGFEAVEAAIKSAMLATGRPGVVVFTGAYHGLGYGTLNATHRRFFRAPFVRQLGGFGYFAPFPDPTDCHTSKRRQPPRDEAAMLDETLAAVDQMGRRHRIGAVLVEPVQGRGGIRVPPEGFLPALRRWCDESGAMLVLDEIFTGMARTGRLFACEHSRTIPDLICLGKALTGGFPLSACVGRADLMDAAWPASSGEALHTSTFLGNPVGCAMALAHCKEIKRSRLVERSARMGKRLLSRLRSVEVSSGLQTNARGLGLMAGLELRRPDGSPATTAVLAAVKEMLRRGFIVLPEGEHSNVLSFTPPLTITADQLDETVDVLETVLCKFSV